MLFFQVLLTFAEVNDLEKDMSSKNTRTYRFNAAKLIDTLMFYLNSKVGPAHNFRFIGDPDNTKLLTDDQVIERLRNFLRASPILESYGPAETFLENLDCFQRFANNWQILRTSDNLKYHSDTIPYFYQNQMFVPKSEIHQKLVEGLVQCTPTQSNRVLARLISISLATRYQQQISESFELVPMKYVEDALHLMAKCYMSGKKTWDLKRRFKIEKWKANLWDYYVLVADMFFMENADEDLLVVLFSHLQKLDSQSPIPKNIKEYEKILERFEELCSLAKTISNSNPFLVQPLEKVKKLPSDVPMGLRFFSDGDANKFMFVKDVEVALSYELRKRNMKPIKAGLIQIETPVQRSLGMIRTMLLDDADKLFLEHGIDLKRSPNLVLVEEKIYRIQDEVTVPVCSPYSTHCKPALDTFAELFDDVCVSLQLFEKAKPDALEKILSYFVTIFDETKEEIYFIEMATVDMIRVNALETLGKLATEPVLHKPTSIYYPNHRNEIKAEIRKMARTITLDPDTLESTIFNFGKDNKVLEYLPGHLTRILVKCVRTQILEISPELSRFVNMQAQRDWVFEDEEEEEEKGEENEEDDEEEDDEGPEPAEIEVHEVVGYQKVDFALLGTTKLTNLTADGSVLMDQSVVYDKCLNYILERNELKSDDLGGLLLDVRDRSKMFNLFVVEESETEEICEKFYKKFLAVELQRCTCNDKKKMTDFDSMWRKTTFCSKNSDFWPRVRKTAEQEWNRRCARDISKYPVCHFNDVLTEFNRLLWARNSDNFCEMAGELMQQRSSIRLLRETRGDGDWHMFGEEVSIILKGVLKRDEKYTAEKRDIIETWERTWFSPFSPGVVSIFDFYQIVVYLKITNHKFLLVSDSEMTNKVFELPLQTTDTALMIMGTGKVHLYSQCQAQLYIFDQLINQNAQKCESWYDEVIEMMKSIQIGYNLVDYIQKMVEKKKMTSTEDRYQEIGSKKKLNVNELEVFHKTRWNTIIDEVFQSSRQNEVELKSNLLKALKVVILDDSKDYAIYENYVKMWGPIRNVEESPLEKAFSLSKDLQAINLRRKLLNIDSCLKYLKHDEYFDMFKKLFPIVKGVISIVNFEPIATLEKELNRCIGACFTKDDFSQLLRILGDVNTIEETKKKLKNYLEFAIKDGKVVCRRFVEEEERNRKKEEVRKQLQQALNKLADGTKKEVIQEKKMADVNVAKSPKGGRDLEEIESAYENMCAVRGLRAIKSRNNPIEKMKKNERLKNVLEERKARAEAEKNQEGCSTSVPEPLEEVKSSKKSRKRAKKQLNCGDDGAFETSRQSDAIIKETIEISLMEEVQNVAQNSENGGKEVSDSHNEVQSSEFPISKKAEVQGQSPVKRLRNSSSDSGIEDRNSTESSPESQKKVKVQNRDEKSSEFQITEVSQSPVKEHRNTSKDSVNGDKVASNSASKSENVEDQSSPQKHRRVSEDSGVGGINESQKQKKLQKELADFKQKFENMEKNVKQLEYEKTNLKKHLEESTKSSSSEIAKLRTDLKLNKDRVERLNYDILSDRTKHENEIERTKKHFEIKMSEIESQKSAEIDKVKKAAEKEKSRTTKAMKEMATENEKLKMIIRELQREAEKREESEKARQRVEAEKLDNEKKTNMKLLETISEMAKDVEKENKKLEEEENKRLKVERRNHEMSIERNSLIAENDALERKITYIQTRTEVNLTLFDLNPSKEEPTSTDIWGTRTESTSSSSSWEQAPSSSSQLVGQSWKAQNENRRSEQVLVPNPLYALVRDIPPPNFTQPPPSFYTSNTPIRLSRNTQNMHFRKRIPLTVYKPH